MSLNQLSSIGAWQEELATLDEEARAGRLQEMVKEVRTHGGCGSLQTASGLPCRRSPKIGYTVCRKHGERAPQTIAKAERLLAVARMPAIEGVLDEIEQSLQHECDTCGFPNTGLKYRKYIASLRWQLLNRTGFGPKQTIDVNSRRLDDVVLDVSVLTDSEFEELGALLESMETLKRRVQSRLASGPTLQLPSSSSKEPS